MSSKLQTWETGMHLEITQFKIDCGAPFSLAVPMIRLEMIELCSESNLNTYFF